MPRKHLSLVAGLAIALMVGTAHAYDPSARKGGYVSGQLGLSVLEDSDIDVSGGGTIGELSFDNGWAGVIAGGYAFGNGWRLEGELGYRTNDLDSATAAITGITAGGASASGDMSATSLMLNVVYDFPLGMSVSPYLGLGIGAARVELDGDLGSDDTTELAYQAIAGVAVAVAENLELTADYRYFGTEDLDIDGVELDYRDHTFLVGLRYRFPEPAPAAKPMAPEPVPPAPAPPPPPRAEPKPAPAPAPAPPPLPRSYIVFFDWDKADVRPDAQRVLETAVANAKRGGFSRIQLTGHADRSGSASYNMGLSLKRTNAVKAALVRLGMNANDISVVARGETEPLVSTADGVREPRNRRVEIVF